MSIRMHRAQRGATLIVGLIMLVLITLMVVSAFNMSSANLKSVGNMQFRDEAIAAANVALERVISSDAVFLAPASSTVSVPPYSVSVGTPVCIFAVDIKAGTSADPNANLLSEGGSAGGIGSGSGNYKITYWDIAAEVSDSATGARAQVTQGVKITLPASPDPCP